MNISDFDFELPEELIAQHAVEPRDHSKLLVLNKDKKLWNIKVLQYYRLFKKGRCSCN